MSVRARLTQVAPRPIRRLAKRGLQTLYTQPTSRFRLLPSFLIIGAQRCGTTSLYRYLAQHPAIGPVVLTKGAHYFSTNYDKGFDWYRSHFPTSIHGRYVKRRHGFDMITGEGSPYYVFHPLAPERVARVLPDVKLIVLVRDPVSRAYSQYRHELDRGFEQLAFEEALEAEPARLAGERERILNDPSYYSFDHQHHSYLARGRYLEQIQAWRVFFTPEQLLVVKSEDFFSHPTETYTRILAFLGLPSWHPPAFDVHNAGHYPKMRPETRHMLTEYYAEPNRALAADLGLDLGWSR
jgi:hypothetical protein